MFKKLIAPLATLAVFTAVPAPAETAVVFFSQTANTKLVAELAADELGVKAQEIKMAAPYRADELDSKGGRARDDHNDDAARPALSAAPDVSAADTVLIGWPVWWGKAPKAVYSWIDGAELEGKKLIPFCTSGSSPIDDSLKALKEAYPTLHWEEGIRFPGSKDLNDADVRAWVRNLAR